MVFLMGMSLVLMGCHGGNHESGANPNEGEVPEQNAEAPDTSFSMERYAWSHRPLLVFAPSPDDQRYRQQRSIIEEHTDGFRDREVVWIEIFSSENPSRAEDETLTAEEANQLRRTFDVDDDTFTVLLVGKDTTVKRRASEPVSAETLFDQIDRMPMRQREMRDRSSDENRTSDP